MIGVKIPQTLRMAADSFRLGMEAAGSEALADATGLIGTKISGWPEQDLQALNGWLELLFTAQSCKNYLYAADILEFQVLPLFSVPDSLVKGDQG